MAKNLTLKERAALIAFAALANGIFFGTLFALEWHNVDYKKWFGFVVFTGLVFGVVIYVHAKDFRTPRSVLVSVALFTIHVAACVLYLRSVSSFPTLLFAVFSPLEAGIVDLILTAVGGVRPRLRRYKRSQPKVEAGGPKLGGP